ncbi:TPA_asm: hypothetical protein [Amaranthus tuberculatus amalgavirus 1]|nr:TPA_asm: hypothetical protein [Amaranthus tuberculatus amalgavirus 1]
MADAEVAPFLRRTDAQWRAAVVAALDEIQGGGFTIRQWELRDLFIEGILPDVFIKNCKQLVNFANTPALRQIFTEGVLARVIESSTDMRIVEFFNFTEWLKTKAGQEAVQRVMLREKNSKRTLPGFSVEETSYTNLLAIQLGDYGVAVKKSRTGFDERISELRRQIAEQEALKAQSLAALEAAFRPASRFVEPTTTIIRREALRMYEEAAQAANNRQVLTGVEAIEASTKEYGQRVRERAMAEFCRAQDVKEGLQRFAVDGIQKASASFQHKEVRRFRNLLAAAGVENLAVIPVEVEDEHAGDDSDGEAESQHEAQPNEPPQDVPERREAPVEGGARGEGEAGPQPEDRAQGRRGGRTAGKRSRAGVQNVGARKSARHTRRA